MIRIKGLDHVVIRAQDVEAMIEFYCDVLGCVVERRSSPEFGIVQLRAGDSLIDIVAVDSEIGRMGGAAPRHFSIFVTNLDLPMPSVEHFCTRI